MEKLSTSVNSLEELVDNSANAIKSLTSRTDEISSVVGLIKYIAEQTNLLALNCCNRNSKGWRAWKRIRSCCR
nr:methyl-accepting chemotaxis protein [Campylobacter pinnipediorum]